MKLAEEKPLISKTRFKNKEIMVLTSKEIGVILKILQEKYGLGYSDAEEDGVRVGTLQAKLSIMAEVAIKSGC